MYCELAELSKAALSTASMSAFSRSLPHVKYLQRWNECEKAGKTCNEHQHCEQGLVVVVAELRAVSAHPVVPDVAHQRFGGSHQLLPALVRLVVVQPVQVASQGVDLVF